VKIQSRRRFPQWMIPVPNMLILRLNIPRKMRVQSPFRSRVLLRTNPVPRMKILQNLLGKMRVRSSVRKIYLAWRWTIAIFPCRKSSIPSINPVQSMRKILQLKLLWMKRVKSQFQARLLHRINPVTILRKILQKITTLKKILQMIVPISKNILQMNYLWVTRNYLALRFPIAITHFRQKSFQWMNPVQSLKKIQLHHL